MLPTAKANIIDSTYGAGAGSFELGAFVDNGIRLYGTRARDTTITGWTVGGPGNGVDWLIEPAFGATVWSARCRFDQYLQWFCQHGDSDNLGANV